MPVRPRLEVGPVNDPFEREADRIAAHVMAMPGAGVGGPAEAGPAGAAVQRACASCGGDHEDRLRRKPDISTLSDEGNDVRMRPVVRRAATASTRERDESGGAVRRREAPGAGGETIGASASQLTSGGRALPDATRSFYEDRMGRDLSGVRVHEGGEADRLNGSIAARAFTYENHVWLSRSEGTAPSFTLAHELAHVLQQTAPGEVTTKREATPGRPKVQRASRELGGRIYFAPGDTRKSMKPHHDKAVQHATGRNRLMGHVRVPNANREKKFVDSLKNFGTADLVLSPNQKMIGLGALRVSNVPNPRRWYMTQSRQGNTQGNVYQPTGLPLNPDLTSHHYRNGQAISAASANTTYHDGEAEPLWHWTNKQFERDATDAPDSHEIGDMKFAGGGDKSSVAKKQVDNYVSGFNFAKRYYDTLQTRGNHILDMSTPPAPGTGQPNARLPDWNFSASEMPALSGEDQVREAGSNITLWPYQINDGEKIGTRMADNSHKGKLFYRQNPNKPYLWEYYFWPVQPDEQTTKKDRDKVEEGTGAAVLLFEQVRTDPSGKKPKARRRPAAQSAPPKVQPLKKRKPPVKADPFVKNYATWKKDQTKFTTDFGKFADPKTGTGKESLEKLAFDTAVRNTVDMLGGIDPGGGRTPPKIDEKKLDASQKAVNTGYLMEGASGKLIGGMRRLFGGAFVKVVNLYSGIRNKLTTFWEGRKKSFSKSRGIGATMMRVAGRMIMQLFTMILPEIGHLLASCVQSGFEALMNKAIENVKNATIAGEVDKVLADIEAQAAEIEAQIDALAEKIVNDLKTEYEAVLSYLETARLLVSIAKAAINAGRLIACIAGGVETVGIACIVAGVDFLLGLVGLSPTEHLAAYVLESCRARKFIADELLVLDTVKAIPKMVAGKIIDHVRPLLEGITVSTPDPLPDFDLDELLCKELDGSVEMPKASDFECGADSDGDGLGGGDQSQDGGGDGGGDGGTAAQQGDGDGGGDGGGGTSGDKDAASDDGGEGGEGGGGIAGEADQAEGGVRDAGEADQDNSSGTANKEPVTTTTEGGIKDGDPADGTAVIVSGITPGKSYRDPVSAVVTYNLGDQTVSNGSTKKVVFRNRTVKLKVLEYVDAKGGGKHAKVYIPNADAATFRNDYPDGSHFKWSPNTGKKAATNIFIQGSDK